MSIFLSNLTNNQVCQKHLSQKVSLLRLVYQKLTVVAVYLPAVVEGNDYPKMHLNMSISIMDHHNICWNVETYVQYFVCDIYFMMEKVWLLSRNTSIFNYPMVIAMVKSLTSYGNCWNTSLLHMVVLFTCPDKYTAVWMWLVQCIVMCVCKWFLIYNIIVSLCLWIYDYFCSFLILLVLKLAINLHVMGVQMHDN